MTFLSVFTPVAAGPDEPTHLYRMAQIADGRLTSQTVTEPWDSLEATVGRPSSEDSGLRTLTDRGGYVDSGFKRYVSANYQRVRAGQGHTFPFWTDPSAPSPSFGGDRVPAVFSNTAVNSPFLYLPQVMGYKLASLMSWNVPAHVISARLAGVLAYCAAVAAAIRLAPFGGWVFAVVGMLPSSLVVNSCVTADTMTTAVCMLFVACVLRACTADSLRCDRAVRLAALLSVVLGFVKLAYFPLAVLTLLVPVLNRRSRSRANLLAVASCLLAGCVCFTAWYLSIDSINTGLMFAHPTDPQAQKTFILTYPVRYLAVIAGLATRIDLLNVDTYNVIVDQVAAPGHAAWLAILAMAAACCVTLGETWRLPLTGTRRLAAALLVLFSVCFVLVCTATYMHWDRPGSTAITGVQARYFLPVLPCLLIGAVTLLAGDGDPRPDTPDRRPSDGTAASWAITACCALSAAVMLYAMMGFYYR